MKLTRLFLLILMAALAFGGSFDCSGSSDDDDDGSASANPPTATRPA